MVKFRAFFLVIVLLLLPNFFVCAEGDNFKVVFSGESAGVTAILVDSQPDHIFIENTSDAPIETSDSDKCYYRTKENKYYEIPIEYPAIYSHGENVLNPDKVRPLAFVKRPENYEGLLWNGDITGFLVITNNGGLKIELKPTLNLFESARKHIEMQENKLQEIKEEAAIRVLAKKAEQIRRPTTMIHLKNGQVMACSVVEKDSNGVWVGVEGGKVYFSNNEIKEIVTN